MLKLRKLDKTERKILTGLIKKVFRFLGTLEPDELDLLSRIAARFAVKNIEVEDEEA